MPKPSPYPCATHHPPSLPTFAPTLVVAGSSFLLSTGLAIGFFCWLSTSANGDDDDWDFSEAGAIMHACATLALKWATCSSVASLIGLVGVVTGRPSLIRTFAIGTALDLVCTIMLLLVLLLVTFTPTLSNPFSTLLCGALTRGELFGGGGGGATTSTMASLRLGLGEREARAGKSGFGVELVMWGVETCEENWQEGMLAVIVGAAVAIAIRVWGTMITWEHHGAVVRVRRAASGGRGAMAEGNDEWFDTEMMMKEAEDEARRRRRWSRGDRPPAKSSTLPILMGCSRADPPLPIRHHGRSKSHTISYSPSSSQGPQLVLVPVFLDGAPSSIDLPPSFHHTFTTNPSPTRHGRRSSSPPPGRATPTRRTSPPRTRDSSSSRSASSSCKPMTTTTSPRLSYPSVSTPSFTLSDEPESFADQPPPPPSPATERRARSRSENHAGLLQGMGRRNDSFSVDEELGLGLGLGLGLRGESGEALRSKWV